MNNILKYMSVVLCVGLVLLSSSCKEHHAEQEVKYIDEFVRGFHEKVRAGNYTSIYKASSIELRHNTDEIYFVQFMSKISSLIGPPSETKRVSLEYTKSEFGEPLIVAKYLTSYTGELATETFHLEHNSSDVILFHYDISSDALLKKFINN